MTSAQKKGSSCAAKLADREAAAAAESATLAQELHEAREAHEVECARLSTQLTHAERDNSSLVSEAEMLQAEMSTHVQYVDLEIARHKNELRQAVAREEFAVDARVQAISVAEESVLALTRQKWSEGRASKELKRAVTAAAAEFSRRFTA